MKRGVRLVQEYQPAYVLRLLRTAAYTHVTDGGVRPDFG